MVLTTPRALTQTHGIVSVLLDHTYTRPSVARMRDHWLYYRVKIVFLDQSLALPVFGTFCCGKLFVTNWIHSTNRKGHGRWDLLQEWPQASPLSPGLTPPSPPPSSAGSHPPTWWLQPAGSTPPTPGTSPGTGACPGTSGSLSTPGSPGSPGYTLGSQGSTKGTTLGTAPSTPDIPVTLGTTGIPVSLGTPSIPVTLGTPGTPAATPASGPLWEESGRAGWGGAGPASREGRQSYLMFLLYVRYNFN